MSKFIFVFMSVLLICGCSDTKEKLKRIGKAPELRSVELPTFEEDEEDIARRKNRLNAEHEHMRRTNSLWQPGSTQFFRDSRAWKVGDIIRVVVEIRDNADLNNSTTHNRNSSDNVGAPNIFGTEKILKDKTNISPDKLLSINSKRAHSGNGKISRKEDIKTEIAATVTKVLPSGNLVVQGHQEVRVNHELREVKIAGIIRPKDISSDNSIKTNQMAEARISYGGRGVVSDVQQPRVGSQVLDAISPF